jgi:protein arginine N-methyltransferase 1
MYDLSDYGSMIADKGRTSAYARALEARVTPTSVVLDIGTGPGILALLACRAGAHAVYAVEPADVIQVAREAAAANGFADRIHFVQAMTTDIDLPERVDGIVADLHGSMPLFGRSVVSILDARTRFLKPGGWIVPARETVWAAPVSSTSAHKRTIEAWTTEYGFDLAGARNRAVNQWLKHVLTPDSLLGEPRCWAVLDYLGLDGPSVRGEMTWTIDHPATGHGIGVWFDMETAPGISVSNSPASGERHVFGQGFLPWPGPIALSVADEIRLKLRADFVGDDYVWGWDTIVTDGSSGREKAAHRQSTWLSAPLSAERLRRRAESFVPDLTETARIDRRILELMDQRASLNEIASKIVLEFPSSIKSLDDALTRAGCLSERYSR